MRFIIFSILVFIFSNVSSGETILDNYDEIAVNIFWNELYPNGGWSLYCGYKFTEASELTDDRLFVIEHIYPVNWMLNHMNCQSRRQCRLNNQSVYTQMEADMHNLYPVWQETYVSRRGTAFGTVEGEYWRFDDCDFERRYGVTEPRPIARGNIARAIFYMHKQYGLPIYENMTDELKRWNMEDLPSKQEKMRNNLIEELQGNRNPYIDNPSLANKLPQRIASDN